MKAQALAKRKSPGVTGLSFQEFPSMESATLARVPPARKALSLGSSMENYWCAARLMARREGVATHFLKLAGFTTYLPKLRESRTVRGRRVDTEPPLISWVLFRFCRVAMACRPMVSGGRHVDHGRLVPGAGA